MRRLRAMAAAFMVCCLILTMLPTVSLAADTGGDIDLAARIAAAAENGTVSLEGDAFVRDNEAPWIIRKNITIEGNGHTVTVWSTGILLGASVTFRNVKLHLSSADSRNAIIANGWKLTLDNVTAVGHCVNLFGGTLLPAQYESTVQVPASGSENTIHILGGTDLQSDTPMSLGTANIFAGSLAMGGLNPEHNTEADDGPANTYAGDVTIRVDDCADSAALGKIYAGGGQQRIPIGAINTKETTANAEKYKVDGTVTVVGAAIPDVDGSGAAAVDVRYQGGSDEAARLFRDVSSLAVETGNLLLKNGSTFRSGGTVSAAAGARLNLSSYPGSLPNFSGDGGFLILAAQQTLSITGTVAGTAKVAVGSISYDQSCSMTPVLRGQIYIQAPLSRAGQFVLLPNSAIPDMKLVLGDGGKWTASDEDAPENLVRAFRFDETAATVGPDEMAEFPITVTGTTQAPLYLDFLPLEIRINGQPANRGEADEDGYYPYTDQQGHLSLLEMVGNTLCVTPDREHGKDDSPYVIAVTVPARYTDGKQDLTGSVTLTVGDGTTEPVTLTGITVNSTGHKTEYKQGESLNVTGLTVLAAYSNDTSRTVPVTADMVSGFHADRTGSQTLTITYLGQTTTYTVTVTAQQAGGGGTGGGGGGGGGGAGGAGGGDAAQPDGAVTVTTTDQATGTVTTVTTHPDGATDTTVKGPDGFAASIRTDSASASAEIHLAGKAQDGDTVVLPIPALPGKNTSITIHTGSQQSTRVEIPVDGGTETTVAYLVGEDGGETIVKTAVLADGRIGLQVSDGATVKLRDNRKVFADVKGHWAEKSIDFITAREIFQGTTRSAFSPDRPMTRGMMMTVLARLDGAEAADIGQGLDWAVAHGISDGKSPELQVSREQLAAMLYRYAGSPAVEDRSLSFHDAAAVHDYARDAVCWAVENGIIGGFENGTLRPGTTATRAQVAAMLSRYLRCLDQQ